MTDTVRIGDVIEVTSGEHSTDVGIVLNFKLKAHTCHVGGPGRERRAQYLGQPRRSREMLTTEARPLSDRR